MTATPEKKMKTKAERKQAAFEKIRDAALDTYEKIDAATWAAYKKKVKEIDDE